MDIARAAHREALRDLQPRPERRTDIPGQSRYDPPPAPPRDTLFSHLFTAISRCVRQTIILEARLAAGAFHPCREPTHHPAPMAPAIAAARPTSQTTDRVHQESLEIEAFEDESLEDEMRAAASRSPDEILADIGEQLDAISTSGLAPQHQADQNLAAKSYRRPIPVIPPGPEAPLTQAEKSALMYHKMHPHPRPRKPDRQTKS